MADPRPLEVVHASNGLTLGGTERTMVNFVLHHDRALVRPRVVAVLEDGPLRAELEAAGVEVTCAWGHPDRLADAFRGADVVHVHRPGTPEPLVPQAAQAAGVPVLVSTNIFGRIDPSPDEARFDCHLFISQMTAWRYRERLGLHGPGFHDRHRVLYNPLDVEGFEAVAVGRRQARERLGLDPDRPVVLRMGRAADGKWRRVLPDMVPHLLRRAPDCQIVFVGATDAIRARLERLGVAGRVVLLEPMLDRGDVAGAYCAADVVVNASWVGESFGVVLAEAMLLGRPVVTTPTPWTDNAQIEVVDPGCTGHVARHPAEIADAIADLLADPARAEAFGSAGAAKARAHWDVRRLTRQLDALYAELTGRAPRPAWDPPPAELDAFGDEYRRRMSRTFRRLTPRERLELLRIESAERHGTGISALPSIARSVVRGARQRLARGR